MKMTAQLDGVSRPLSVELRLINSWMWNSGPRHQHATSFGAGLLIERSNFRSAKGLIGGNTFEGVAPGRAPTMTGNDRLELPQPASRRHRNGFGAAEHVELGENVAQVALYRAFADKKVCANF